MTFKLKKIQIFISLVLMLFILSSLALVAGPVAADTTNTKNIILMIADGTGFNHLLIADYYQYGKTGEQVYQSFPVQLACSTYEYEAADLDYPYPKLSPYPTENPNYVILGYDPDLAWSDFNYARWMEDPYDGIWAPYRNNSTDSASAGTAIATGVKCKDGNIGVNINGESVKNIVEYATEAGKATGVVTSVSISHATPASMVAHNVSRSAYADLANEMLFQSDLTVLMGTGCPDHNNNGVALPYTYTNEEEEVITVPELNPRLIGGPETWAAIKLAWQKENPAERVLTVPDKEGWTIIRAEDEFTAMALAETVPARLLGLPFAYDTLQWQRDPGSYYDPGAPYTVPFNENVPFLKDMVPAALNVLDKNGGDNGFFLMIEGGAVDWGGHFFTPGRLVEELIDFNLTVEAVVDWIEDHGGWDENLLVVTADHETGYLWGPDAGEDENPWTPIQNNGVGEMPGFTYNANIYALDEESGEYYPSFWWHTNSLVPVFAKGVGSELFTKYASNVDPRRGAYIDNTDFIKVFTEAYGIFNTYSSDAYDKYIELNEGWTILSTDSFLDPAATRVNGHVSMVYQYVPGQGYLTADLYEVTPVDAFYIKTTGFASVGYNYDANTLPGVSAKELAAGWNLISSGTEDDAQNILSPLRYIQVGNEQGVNLATLVSQGGFNLNTANWYIDATEWTNLTGKTLNPFDGYWIYLNVASHNFGVIPSSGVE